MEQQHIEEYIIIMKAFKFRFELKVIDKQQIFQRSKERNGEGAGEAGSGDKKKEKNPSADSW